GIASAQEVNVYSTRSHYGSEPAFELFTEKTGIKVNFFMGNNNEVFERLRAEGADTGADVMVTVDAGNLWNAAREGLLMPVESEVLMGNVPAHLRDPENRWFGLAVRARTIMYSTERVKPSELSTYAALADPKWKGRICLRTSNSIYNQSLLASAIGVHGEAVVEKMIGGWIANEPEIVNSDRPVLRAIAAGQCDVGITNSYYLARILAREPDLPVAPFWANQETTGTHVNISGAGVTKYAKNKENAVRLLEFITSVEAQETLAASSFEYPANPAAEPHAVLKGWGGFKQEQVGVAAAGENQVAAIKLADRAGYR
ncbi:MAG: extracellular solute-binding protein, partial [Gammaproteobacteria bacterium]|nr:extracellular solute-binding protein [Gammaproteobacteria bacterium]